MEKTKVVKQKISLLIRALSHLRVYIFRGFLACLPVLLCFFAIQLIYYLIDKRIVNFLGRFFEVRLIPGLGIIIMLFFFYVIGIVASNFLGNRFLRFVEKIMEKIPIIKGLYGMGKQLSESLSVVEGEKQAFKKAIFVRMGNKIVVPGFIMSSFKSRTTKEELFFVLIPTSPTPASGFTCIVKASDIIDPGLSVEEGLKLVVSAGIIFPREKIFDL